MANSIVSVYWAVLLLTLVYSANCETPKVELVPLPVLNNYSASGADYDDGGMEPLYNFARSFINTALPGGFPTQFVNNTIHDMSSLDIMEALNMFKGYLAAIAVGVLFIIICPLVGLCFCCCRICGNCGGSGDQKVTDNIHLKRRVFASILLVLTVFTFVGNICTYVSNERISVALDEITETVDNNLDDIDSYLDLVQQQVETIGIINLNITKHGILHYMDANKLKEEISTYVIDSVSGGALTNMQKHITDTASAFDDVVTNKKALGSVANGIPGADVTRKEGTFGHSKYLTQVFNKSPVSQIILDISHIFAQLAVLGAQKVKFDTFAGAHIVKTMKDKVSAKLALILKPAVLTSQLTNINSAFNAIDGKVINVVKTIRDFRQNAKSGLDLEDYKRQVRDYTDTAKSYDKYRYSAAAGLGAITTVIIALQLLGLLCGSVGQGWSTEPAQRGCLSVAGGNFLMASVGFVFIFSWLLMLLTTLCFSVGAVLERFVCQPLSSSDLKLIELANSFAPKIEDIDADLVDILKDCRDDKSAYIAFHLDSKFDLNTLDTTLDTQKQQIDNSLNDVLKDVKNMGPVTFGSVTSNLNDFKTSLNGIPFQTLIHQLQSTMASLPSTVPGYTQKRDAMNKMIDDLKQLEKAKNQVDTWNSEFSTGMTKAQSDMSSKITQVMDDFKKKITGVADEYVTSTKKDVRDNLGRCSPVWNLYESIVQVGLCKYTVDAFNGFWFSIGWCIFFSVPSIVFSVKLAKHYRRMNVEKGLDRESSISYNAPVHRRSNKVGHMDELPLEAPTVGY